MFENGSVSTDFESEKSLLGVLVAISIPIFTNQLEKSREATDAANIRNAIADVSVQYLSADVVSDTGYAITVNLKQKTDGWVTAPEFLDSKGTAISGAPGTPKAGGTCKVAIDKNGVLGLTFSK